MKKNIINTVLFFGFFLIWHPDLFSQVVLSTSDFNVESKVPKPITPAKGSYSPVLAKSPNVDHVCKGYPVLSNVTFQALAMACTDVVEYRFLAASGWSAWAAYVPNDTIFTDTLSEVQIRAYQLTCDDAGTLFNTDTTVVSWTVHAQITRNSFTRIPSEAGVCLGASLSLEADSTVTGQPVVIQYQYQPPTLSSWTTGNAFAPADAGMGWIKSRVVSGQFGCATTDWEWFAWLVQPQPEIQGLASQLLCPSTSVELTANVVDGYGSTFYQWEKATIDSNGVWDSVPGASSAFFTTPILDSTAYYRLRVTQSGFNCQSTSSCVVLQVNPPAVISISAPIEVCVGAPITIVATVADGIGSNHYQYQYRYAASDPWTNVGIDDDTLSITTLAQSAEFRCLLAQTGLGCFDTSNVVSVAVNQLPTIGTQPTQTSACIGFSSQLMVRASAVLTPTFQWYGPNGLIVGDVDSILVINPVGNSDTGYYHCTVSNACGSISSDSALIHIISTYVAPDTIFGNARRCVGPGLDTYVVKVQNPVTFSWSLTPSAAGTINSSNGLVDWDSTWIGTATIGYQAAGCGLSTSLTLNVNTLTPVVNPTMIIGDTMRCQGVGTSLYSADATNDTGYVWMIVNAGNSVIQSDSGMVTWDPLFSGTATVSVFARGCQGPTSTISKQVVVYPTPIMAISDSLHRCEGESATIFITSTDTSSVFSYQWFGPSGLIPGAIDTIFTISPITVADSGAYFCQVTLGCGNSQTLPAILVAHRRPIPLFVATSNCERDTVRFANSSATNDMPMITQWYFGDGDSSLLYSPTHIYADSGSYTVRLLVETAYGCKDSLSNVVPAFSLPLFNMVTTNDSCYADSTGTISITTFFGKTPYTYALDNLVPQDTSYITSIPAGLHTVTVKDANNCLVRDTVTIYQPTQMVSTYTSSHVKCFSDTTGLITVNVSGGTTPYVYRWSNGDSTKAVVVPAGNYDVIITDSMGCDITYNAVLVSQPSRLVIDSTIRQTTCILFNDAMITVSAEGGYGDYAYLWSDNSTNDTLQNLAPGNYSVTITDENGCTHRSNFVIDYNPEPCWHIWTSFSPNGDGQNDVWNIRWANQYPTMVVQVFNKWGNMVYENKGEFNGWDGSGPSGKLLPSETYYYVINLNDGSTPIQTGTVTIVY